MFAQGRCLYTNVTETYTNCVQTVLNNDMKILFTVGIFIDLHHNRLVPTEEINN